MNFETFKSRFQKKEVTAYFNEVVENPLVSICVQAYQHRSYIEECLDGILMQQTSFSFEILLGEDSSSDGTTEICIQYAEKYPDKIRLFLHHRENNIKINGNFTGRFNLLYNLFSARGKYIAICEGDDYWTDPLKLEKQIKAFDRYPEANICSHVSIKYDDDQKKNVGKIGNNGDKACLIPIREVILRYGSIAPMQTIMLRNQNLEDYVDVVINAYGAHGLMQVFWAHPVGILYLPEEMAVYRTNSANSVTKTVLINKQHYLKAMLNKLENFNALNNYFSFIYDSEFKKAKVISLHNIVQSRLVSFGDKMSIVGQYRKFFTLPKLALLLLRSTLSSAKYFMKGGFLLSKDKKG